MMSGIESGIDIDKINVALKLVILKPLNAPLIIQLYNHMISTEGRAIIIECWQWAGILEAVGPVGTGEKDLPRLDPFHDINLLLESMKALETTQMTNEKSSMTSDGDDLPE